MVCHQVGKIKKIEMKSDNEYDVAKSMISHIKNVNESVERKKKFLKESSDKRKNDPIAITNDPKFGQNVLKNQIDSFRKSVSGGAKFSDENSDDAESNPLVFYPESGNLIFSGSIPSMSGLKFQFSLNDMTNAPYIFVDGLAVTEDVITMINKLNGYYKNWKEEFLAATDLLDRLVDGDED